jgi:hypothetical protein
LKRVGTISHDMTKNLSKWLNEEKKDIKDDRTYKNNAKPSWYCEEKIDLVQKPVMIQINLIISMVRTFL